MTDSSPPAPFDLQALLAQREFLRALARGLLADEHRAEDVVQQACVAALARPPGSVERLRAWLAGTVRNLARKSQGQESERRARERLAARREWREEVDQDFELQERVASALRALPEPYRSTIHLRYYRDLGPRRIAELQGLSVDTVKTRLRRGLELLRADFRGSVGPDWRAPLAALVAGPLAGGGSPWLGASSPAAPGSVAAIPGASGGTAVTAPLLYGVLTMKALGLTVASVTAAAAVVVLVRWNPTDGGALHPRGAVERSGVEVELARAPTPADVETAHETRDPGRVAVATPEAELPASAAPVARVARLRAVDADGAPVAQVRVTFARAGSGEPGAAADTGADGRAELELAPFDADDADRTLVLAADDHLTLRRAVTLGAGPAVDLGTFVMVRGGTLRGVVVDPAGIGVANALVVVSDPGERFWAGVENLADDRDRRLTTRTEEDGDFLLRAVPAGLVRLWAAAPGLVDGVSDVVAVSAGEEVVALEIRLRPAAAGDEIAGRVRLPEEARRPTASQHATPQELTVWHSHVAPEGARTSTTPVGPDGRFRFRVENRVPHDVWVQESPRGWDERKHVFTGERVLTGWRAEVAREVAPGTSDLLLGFERASTIEVSAVDPGGSPIDVVTLGVIEFSGEDLRREIPWYRQVSPPVRIDVPANGFYVTVSAEGHDRASFGPYDTATAPESIVAELAPIPLVAGRVIADGRPVAGALVEAFRAGRSTHRITSRGFTLRMSAAVAAEGLAGDDGAFGLTVRRAERYFLRASAPGWSSVELGPLAIDPSVGAADLELELTRGGAIEGRLILPPGDDPSGHIVGASNGDPYPRTYTVAADGRFRFEGLAPGEWLVDQVTQYDQSTSISSSRTPVIWSGNCRVEAGEVTRFDVDLADSERIVLRGRLEVEGRSTQGWSARLAKQDDSGAEQNVDSATLAEGGGFELVAPAPGEYRLFLESEDFRRGGLVLLRNLTLEHSPHEWSERIDLGALRCELASPPGPLLVFIVADGGDLTATPLLEESEGVYASANAPVGKGRIHYPTEEMSEQLPTEWPVLGSVEVKKGETARFDGK